MIRKNRRKIFLILAVCLLNFYRLGTIICQTNIHVRIENYGANIKIADAITQNLQSIMILLNSSEDKKEINQKAKNICTENGLNSLSSLIKNNKIKFIKDNYFLQLIMLEEQGFQVRDIEVLVTSLKEDASRMQYLVVNFDKSAKIDEVHYSMWNQYSFYDISPVISNKEKLIIENFLESYQTAFINKNIEKINSFFKDEALIIVGMSIKEQSLNKTENADLFFRTKANYIERLKDVFKRNEFIIPYCDKIKISRHNTYSEIYAVSCFQRWETQKYRDEGWLFLIFDFSDKSHPNIILRNWTLGEASDEGDFGEIFFDSKIKIDENMIKMPELSKIAVTFSNKDESKTCVSNHEFDQFKNYIIDYYKNNKNVIFLSDEYINSFFATQKTKFDLMKDTNANILMSCKASPYFINNTNIDNSIILIEVEISYLDSTFHKDAIITKYGKLKSYFPKKIESALNEVDEILSFTVKY